MEINTEHHGFAKLEIPFFPCDICEESFTDERELTQHVKNSHEREETINLHCCSTCGKGYRYFAALKRHQLTHSGDSDVVKYHKPRKIKCINKDMVTIVKRHGKNNARCQENNKRPVTKGRPGKKHVVTPADKKTPHPKGSPYRCLDCGEDFRTFTTCQRHQTNHAKGKDLARNVQEGTQEVQVSEAPMSPELGDTKRQEEEDVSFHVTNEDADLTSKGKQDNETEISKYSCLDCGRIFKRLKCYQKHCETHKKPLDTNKEETKIKKHKPNAKGHFRCPVCGRAFNNRTILTKHKQIYHRKDSSVAFTTSDPLRPINKHDLRCCECDRYFDDRDTFHKHQCYHLRKYLRAFLAADRVSESGDLFYCQLCILTFSNGQDFEIHVKNMHVEEYNKTTGAGHKFSQQSTSQKKETEINTTERTEVDEDASTHYTCEVCGTVLKDFYSLRRHRETHIKAARLYHCEICGRDFGRSDHLKRHSYIHSAVGGSFTCSVCGVKFTNPRKLQSHEKLHLVKSHTCQVCGKQYVLKEELDFHHETAHPGPEGYSCRQCSKTFSDIKALRRHRRTHSPHRHGCVHCGKTFRRLDKLRQHKVLHTNEKPHLCDHCGTMFARRDYLREHVLIHESKSFLCTVCGKHFNNRQSLRRHNVAHKTGSQRFRCENCGKSFSRKDHLKRHSHQHCTLACPQGRRVFSCKDCGKSFRRKEWLKHHSYPLCASSLTLALPRGCRVTFQRS